MPLNPWLRQKIEETHSPAFINVLVEVTGGKKDAVLAAIKAIPGAQATGESFNMIHVTVPFQAVKALGAIHGVLVHYDAPMGLKSPPVIKDALLGLHPLSAITVPFTPWEMPGRILANSIPKPSGKKPVIIPVSETRKLFSLPDDVEVKHTLVGILDTGVAPHPAFRGLPHVGRVGLSTGLDSMGHGSWVATALGGWPTWSRFGPQNGVVNVHPRNLYSFKVLNDLGGGSVSTILKGLEAAVKADCKVVNLSLGGALQGRVTDDPLCRVLESLKDTVIVVCAAGNSGPEMYTINSPGASPYALTVGAVPASGVGLSSFSSRGFNGAWYKSHSYEDQEDRARYQWDFVKPDLVMPGGDVAAGGGRDELLMSGMVGWMQPAYVLPDLWGGMRGSSQSTPQATALVALAYEKGYIRTAKDVKDALAASGPKDQMRGYGLMTWPRLIKGMPEQRAAAKAASLAGY